MEILFFAHAMADAVALLLVTKMLRYRRVF